MHPRWIKLAISAAMTVFVFAAAAVVFIVVGSAVNKPKAQAGPTSCVATLAGGAGGPAPLNEQQRGIVGSIIAVGKQRQLPPRAWQIAVQAGQTESHLTNIQGGDRDSAGVFQMRPSKGWGTQQEITNVSYAVNKFYDRLTSVPGWETLRPGDAAQKVEASQFPQRYAQAEALAVSTVQQLGGVTAEDLTGCKAGGNLGENTYSAKAVEFANVQFGKPYVWGATGPDAFDCSGLITAAYQQAGLSLPRSSGEQYNAGKHVPVAEAQPGDLVFWADDRGNPEAIHHVALYVGNGEVIQAPQDGESVKKSRIWPNQLVPMATRPGVAA